MLKYLVSFEWLNKHMNDKNVRVIDCRFELGSPMAGFEDYLKDHLPNAIYVDLEKDLSSCGQAHGGRHPLPNSNELISKLEGVGIDETMKVVVYDDQGGAMASRLWWLLKYLGHNEVYVLNSSYSNWKKLNFETTVEIPTFAATKFHASINEQMLSSMDEVKQALKDESTILIDSREWVRFFGIEEPIDKVAGHIPTAKHYFWKELMDSNGKWRTVDFLKERFQTLQVEQEIIVYCGSGVTACPNVLALNSLGYQNVKLYAGSWSDWISYPDNTIGK
ncbi:sulfurtransferase [Bacillaceae bacterium IKA-2]|nr:sulfurtransferase [Bacillaceae bacterium IKA-2]